MPELPDLEIFSRNLTRLLAGKCVKRVMVWNESKAGGETLNSALQGRTLRQVAREGKQTHFLFDNGQCLAVHLMLTGEFHLAEKVERIEFAQLGIEFDGAPWLIVSDQRGWAAFTLNPPPSSVPDALGEEFTLEYLRAVLKKRPKMAIKGFLVDQNIVRGIGNAYADEILWASRIAPQSPGGHLPEEVIAALYRATGEVLRDAIAQIDAIAPDVIDREIRSFLKVHGAGKKQCPNGHKIQRVTIASKTTYFCEEQVGY